jgi:hypothetical protein
MHEADITICEPIGWTVGSSISHNLKATTTSYGGELFVSICAWCSCLTGNTYVPPRPVRRIASHFICRLCSYPTGNTYVPPRPVTPIASPFICRWCSYPTGNTYVPAWPATWIPSFSICLALLIKKIEWGVCCYLGQNSCKISIVLLYMPMCVSCKYSWFWTILACSEIIC